MYDRRIYKDIVFVTEIEEKKEQYHDRTIFKRPESTER